MSLLPFIFKMKMNEEKYLRRGCDFCFICSLDPPPQRSGSRGKASLPSPEGCEGAGLLPPACLVSRLSLLSVISLFLHFWAGPTSHSIIFSSPTKTLTCFSRGFFFPLPRRCDDFSACAFKGVGNIVCWGLTPCISPRSFVQLLMNS